MANSEDFLKHVLAIVLVVASFWDGFTTLYGTYQLLGGEGGGQAVASLLFAVLITTLLLNTKRIMSMGESFEGNLSKVLWFLAFAYDLYTAWEGNHRFLVDEVSGGRAVVLFGLTGLTTGAPMLLSFQLDDWF